MIRLQFKSTLFLWLLCGVPYLLAQQPAGVTEIKGRVFEHNSIQKVGLSGVVIHLVDYDQQYQTDANGYFNFKVPLKNNYIKIDIPLTDYQIVKPLEGIVDIQSARLQVEILVMGKQAQEQFQAQISNLNGRIKALEQQNKLSKRQLTALYNTMVDTILHFERQNVLYQDSIQKLSQQVEEYSEESYFLGQKLESTKQELSTARDSIQNLLDQLMVALEEKYLRQQDYFQQISSGLARYVSTLRDFQIMLAQLKDYLYRPEAQAELEKIINNYSAARNYLNEQHQDHINAVEHYWEDSHLEYAVNDTYEFLLEDIHKAVILTTNERVFSPMRESKIKKAKEAAAEINLQLDPLIQTLEKKVQTVNEKLRTTF